ncbi:MAG: hypothetical protein AAB225_06060 [Acidobacteriota bacterium]
MRTKIYRTLVVSVLFSAAALAQTQGGLLDVFVVKVRPEKRAEFDAVIKKMVDINRRHQGDTWLASEISWGEANTVYFSSLRQNHADLEKAYEAFMGAMTKAGGPALASKLMQEMNNCVISARGELRRLRPELSRNAPSDQEGIMRLVGQSRWLRTTLVRVRPGRFGDYQEQLQAMKEAAERADSKTPVLVSQGAGGQQGTVFYITVPAGSLAAFDEPLTPLPKLLGEEGYRRYTAAAREAVLSSETFIHRYVPELSNPPQAVVSAAPDFWRPKPPAAVAAARTKAKHTE